MGQGTNSSNVTTAKPKVGGAIYRAKLSTALPTDAVSELSIGFESLGHVSDDGLTNGSTRDSQQIKAWGGAVVDESQTSFADTFKFKLIEATNTTVLKTVFGDKNVTGDLATGISVTVNSEEQEEFSWVVDTILKNNTLKRMVIPKGKVTNVADIVYADGKVIGYEITITAFLDDNGNNHYEYIKGKEEQ